MTSKIKILPVLLIIIIFASCQESNDFVEPIAWEKPDFIPLTSNTNIAKYTSGDIEVTNANSLQAELNNAAVGQVVFIPGDLEFNIETQIFIPDGIILASDRNNGSSLGAKIFRTDTLVNKWIKVGDNVEISGLRLQGPHPNINKSNSTTGISAEGKENLDVNGCEISAFSSSAIYFKNSDGVVSNNYIHHNRRNRLGYGVQLDSNSTALIEKNLFDFNRHDISGSGHCAQSYEARYNIVLKNGTSHSFDMHGLYENTEILEDDCAGSFIYIHNNTFMRTDDYAISIRGIPQIEAKIEQNTFYHSLPNGTSHSVLDAIHQRDSMQNPMFPFENINVMNNEYQGALNGNNSKDVIVLTPGNQLKKYIFDDNEFFYKTYPIVGNGFNFKGYLVGNWSNNGTSDLIVRNSSGYLYLYRYNGSSFYGQGNPHQFGYGFINFTNYLVGKWSSGPHSDLIARKNDGKLYRYTSNGNNLNGQGVVGYGFNFEEYFVGDWTNNGTSDLMTVDSGGKLRLYRFNATSFSSLGVKKTNFIYENYFPGKWTGDNISDIITLDSNGDLWLYEFNGANFLNKVLVGNGFNYVDYCVGDFTGDGIDDLLTIDEENSIYLFPFKNKSFYNNGGPIKIGHNLFFKEFLIGQWGN